MIRHARYDDIPAIAILGELFHQQAQWGDIFEYSAADCATSLETFMGMDGFLCLVDEIPDRIARIVGMAAGIVSPVYFNFGHLSGEELFWWVSADAPHRSGIKLLDALEAAAKAKGCHSWQMKSIARLNGDRMGRLYERRGYRASEHSFIKRL